MAYSYHDLVIFISDIHEPYSHKDSIPFVSAIRKKYWNRAGNPLAVFLGDELTYHGISFHPSDPDVESPGHELDLGISRIRKWHTLFPKAYVMESNHGSLLYRKQKFHGIPKFAFKNYNQLLGIPQKDWKWVNDLVIPIGPKKDVYVCHNRGNDVLKLSQSLGMSAVMGHIHEKMNIQYWGSQLGTNFAMQCGCLIDNTQADFDYNKINLKTPMIGTGVIVNGVPKIYLLIVDRNNRWIGELI